MFLHLWHKRIRLKIRYTR